MLLTHFLSLCHGRIEFGTISVVSGVFKDGFTSNWVYVVGTKGGSEKCIGEYKGVTGEVFGPSSSSSSDISGEGSTGSKGSLSLGMLILSISLSSSNNSCEQSKL